MRARFEGALRTNGEPPRITYIDDHNEGASCRLIKYELDAFDLHAHPA